MINLSSFIGQANIRSRKTGSTSPSDKVGRIFAPLRFSGASKTVTLENTETGEKGEPVTSFKNSYRFSADFEKLAELQNHSITYLDGMILTVKHGSDLEDSLKPSKKAKDGGKSMLFSSNVLDFQLHSVGLLPTESLVLGDVDNSPIEGFKNLQYTEKVKSEFDLVSVPEELTEDLKNIGVVAVYKVIPFDKEAATEKAKAENSDEATSNDISNSVEETVVKTEEVAQTVGEAEEENWED
jgi:hypothetical protein